MKARCSSDMRVILYGIGAWLAVCCLKGFSISHFPLLAVFITLGFSSGTVLFPMVLGCSVIAVLSPSLQPWAILVSGVLSSVTGADIKVRIPGLAAVASSFWLLPLSASIPLAAVSAAGVIFGDSRVKYLLIPGGFLATVFLTGLPAPPVIEPVVAGSVIEDRTIVYSVPELNTSRPAAVLPAPFEGTWTVMLSLETGGIRDTLPVAAVCLGEDTLLFPAGADVIDLTISPGDTLAVILLREFRPLNHSVIYASLYGELL